MRPLLILLALASAALGGAVVGDVVPVSVIRERAVCDGYDVTVLLPSGQAHTFHFAKKPVDVKPACAALADALAAVQAQEAARRTTDAVAADLAGALADAQVSIDKLAAARTIAEVAPLAVDIKAKLAAVRQLIEELRRVGP